MIANIKNDASARRITEVKQVGPSSFRERKRRRAITPGLLILLVFMGGFGLYATGNFPRLDEWTNDFVRVTQSHNDDVVGAFINNWEILGLGIASLVIIACIFLMIHRRKVRWDDEH